jgi:hypothetical protein
MEGGEGWRFREGGPKREGDIATGNNKLQQDSLEINAAAPKQICFCRNSIGWVRECRFGGTAKCVEGRVGR